jgi:hypothetical protein
MQPFDDRGLKSSSIVLVLCCGSTSSVEASCEKERSGSIGIVPITWRDCTLIVKSGLLRF